MIIIIAIIWYDNDKNNYLLSLDVLKAQCLCDVAMKIHVK